MLGLRPVRLEEFQKGKVVGMKQPVRIYGAKRVLREIRAECDLSSLRQVAKTIGVSPAYLSDILLGKRGVSESIATAFGFTREDVVTITYRPRRDGAT